MIYIWLYPLETNCLLYTLPTNDVLDNVRQNSKTWWFPITQVRIIARSSIVIMHPRKTIIHWSVTINTGYRTFIREQNIDTAIDLSTNVVTRLLNKWVIFKWCNTISNLLSWSILWYYFILWESCIYPKIYERITH